MNTDFNHSWGNSAMIFTRDKWKSLLNCLMSDQNRYSRKPIHYFLFLSWSSKQTQYNNNRLLISSFCQRRYFLTWHCRVSTVQSVMPLIRKRNNSTSIVSLRIETLFPIAILILVYKYYIISEYIQSLYRIYSHLIFICWPFWITLFVYYILYHLILSEAYILCWK